ncbi:MAG: 16S rRNA (guanine(966)-N(2))-methyltransferase RsmD [Clostridia bacterium]
MRIIAGKCRAKVLNSPKTEKTRPTLDRVKEALFSIIDEYLEDSDILDLFAGTGNLAIESLSRGAKFAWINDIENICVSTIISNILLTKMKEYVKITRKDYMKALKQIEKENKLFDVIFLDPPYDSRYGLKSLEYISNTCNKILKKDGIIIYETDKNFIKKIQQDDEELLDSFVELKCIDTRNYGNVILKLYKWR